MTHDGPTCARAGCRLPRPDGRRFCCSWCYHQHRRVQAHSRRMSECRTRRAQLYEQIAAARTYRDRIQKQLDERVAKLLEDAIGLDAVQLREREEQFNECIAQRAEYDREIAKRERQCRRLAERYRELQRENPRTDPPDQQRQR